MKLFDYQIEGVKSISNILENSKGMLLADEMGLGKTIQAIEYINQNESIRRILIVCPLTLKINWRTEIEKWCTRSFALKAEIEISNYESLHKIKITRRELFIVDEAHRIKNPNAQYTNLVKCHEEKARKTIFITGTPILNRPIELWPMLQMINPHYWDPPGRLYDKKIKKHIQVGEGAGAGYEKYAMYFCNAHFFCTIHGGCKNKGCKIHTGFCYRFDLISNQYIKQKNCKYSFYVNGESNIEELGRKLKDSCMVRRLKIDVLKELPAKTRQIIELPSEDKTDSEKLLLEELTPENYDLILQKIHGNKERSNQIFKARHEDALIKIPDVESHIHTVLQGGVQKIIVFFHHTDVGDNIIDRVKDWYPYRRIDGNTNQENRDKYIKEFQTNPDIRIMFGSLRAAGVGRTMTAASHVIFAELDWTPAIMAQAEDRAHRIGQLEPVLIHYLVLNHSIDAKIIKILIKKQEMLERMYAA